MIDLKSLGCTDFFVAQWSADERNAGLSLGRVSHEHKTEYRICTESGECKAKLSGRLRFLTQKREDLPAVGDWVICKVTEGEALIRRVLTRKSAFARGAPGGEGKQLIATNIDFAFVVTPLNLPVNLRKLERYVTAIISSGVKPVVLLSKPDLCSKVSEEFERVKAVLSEGVFVHVVNALTGEGLDALERYVKTGVSSVIVGSSGVGKSTLVNALAQQELLLTAAIREVDGKGRHTTTHRALVSLKSGGILIDTPGMREFHVLENEEGISSFFGDLEELAARCRFKNCTHEEEPGCAVLEAIENGTCDEKRFESFRKLERASFYERRKHKKTLANELREQWKSRARESRVMRKQKRSLGFF